MFWEVSRVEPAGVEPAVTGGLAADQQTVPACAKKTVCESGLTSHSHNAYRPITPLQPEGSQTHAQAPNTLGNYWGKIGKRSQTKRPSAGTERGAAAWALLPRWVCAPGRDGSGPGIHVNVTNAALETFWWVNCFFIMWLRVLLRACACFIPLSRARTCVRDASVCATRGCYECVVTVAQSDLRSFCFILTCCCGSVELRVRWMCRGREAATDTTLSVPFVAVDGSCFCNFSADRWVWSKFGIFYQVARRCRGGGLGGRRVCCWTTCFLFVHHTVKSWLVKFPKTSEPLLRVHAHSASH